MGDFPNDWDFKKVAFVDPFKRMHSHLHLHRKWILKKEILSFHIIYKLPSFHIPCTTHYPGLSVCGLTYDTVYSLPLQHSTSSAQG